MSDEQLKRCLQSIGMACFVKYFYKFRDPSRSSADLVELLMKEKCYEESGARVRVSQARKIISHKREVDAIRNVAAAKRVPSAVADEAKSILIKFLSP